jgi:hypothetical protein
LSLTPHPTGRWCKKIRGKIHYFGPIADWQKALNTYLEDGIAVHGPLESGRRQQHSGSPARLVREPTRMAWFLWYRQAETAAHNGVGLLALIFGLSAGIDLVAMKVNFSDYLYGYYAWLLSMLTMAFFGIWLMVAEPRKQSEPLNQ